MRCTLLVGAITLLQALVALGQAATSAPDAKVIEVRPGQSIQAALDIARPGQTVLLQPGVYKPVGRAEAMLVWRAGKNGVTLRGGGRSPSEVVLDGNQQVLHVLFLDEGLDRTTVVENLTVTGGLAYPKKLLGAGHKPTLRPELDNLDNDFYTDGAGMMLFLCSPTIRNCRVVDNRAKMCGAGISVFCLGDKKFPPPGPLIFGCRMLNNIVEDGTGGGVDVYFRARAEIVNNLFVGNKGWGAAVAVLDEASAEISFATIVGNRGSISGVAAGPKATLRLSNSIFASNRDGTPLEFAPKAKGEYDHCCFWDNDDEVAPRGKGHVKADPLFAKGPGGEHCLSDRASGQGAASPCIDAGAGPAESCLVAGLSTRTDGKPDSGAADLGYHAPATTQASE